MPEYRVCPAKELVWQKKPLVVQWAHGHSGDGTVLVNSQADLDAIQKKFPERPAKASSLIIGPSFTLNVVVESPERAKGEGIHIGNISCQLTGIAPFTDNIFTTVGNDWSISHDLLSEEELEEAMALARKMAMKMRESGWKGLFGLDIMRDKERGRLYLIEINARQPASVAFESQIQESNRARGLPGLTIFEAHVKALLGEPVDRPIIPVNDGAQVIQRVTAKVKVIPEDVAGSLELAGYKVIAYPNTGYNDDLLRIQSEKGIMENYGKLNARGTEIADIISDEH
jgi:formate-dependent phosphoribosylglycinamide formyltransferase (GAR transformylase)